MSGEPSEAYINHLAECIQRCKDDSTIGDPTEANPELIAKVIDAIIVLFVYRLRTTV